MARSTPRVGPPPTQAEIEALAKKEHVPTRIAKGHLDGKMKCHVWRKLHREEAARFDQAYALLEKHPELPLADAFGVIQSGMSVEDFQVRRARALKKESVKKARTEVAGERIDAVVQGFVDRKTEMAVVLGERTVLDVLAAVERVSFVLERTGRLDKLQVVVMTRREVWDQHGAQLERDPKLSQKPAAVARQPERRPVSDPRIFLPLVGGTVHLLLRNGIHLAAPLLAVGPYDLLVGVEGEELFVPLHGILKWGTEASAVTP